MEVSAVVPGIICKTFKFTMLYEVLKAASLDLLPFLAYPF